MQEICSHKFYVSKNLESWTKIITAFEQNGSRVKRFPQPELSDVNEALFKRFKQDRSDDVPVGGPLLIANFFLLKF